MCHNCGNWDCVKGQLCELPEPKPMDFLKEIEKAEVEALEEILNPYRNLNKELYNMFNKKFNAE